MTFDRDYREDNYGEPVTAEELLRSTCKRWIDSAGRWADRREKQGEAVDWDGLRARMRPFHDEVHRIDVARQMYETVPIRWIHKATDEEVAAKISSAAMLAASDECCDGTRNVVLLGKTGVGKSTTLALMARKFYRQQRSWNHIRFKFAPVRWVLTRDLANAVLAHPLGRGLCEAVTKAQDAAVLVLDDLGLEKDHGAVLDVLQARYEHGRPTWVTSGLTVAQIVERYGEAFYRRLCEMNGTAGKVITAFKAPGKLAAV